MDDVDEDDNLFGKPVISESFIEGDDESMDAIREEACQYDSKRRKLEL